jgi:hypothetical protein
LKSSGNTAYRNEIYIVLLNFNTRTEILETTLEEVESSVLILICGIKAGDGVNIKKICKNKQDQSFFAADKSLISVIEVSSGLN